MWWEALYLVFFPSEVTKLYFFSEIARREDSDVDGEYRHANKEVYFVDVLSGILLSVVRAIPAP